MFRDAIDLLQKVATSLLWAVLNLYPALRWWFASCDRTQNIEQAIEFYQNMQAGNSVVLALNKAQLWLRNVTKVELQKWFEENQLPLSATVNIKSKSSFS